MTCLGVHHDDGHSDDQKSEDGKEKVRLEQRLSQASFGGAAKCSGIGAQVLRNRCPSQAGIRTPA
jgi:hypothetical protein